jgi:hypothetical protein
MIGCLRYVAYRILAAATVDWSSVCPFDLRVLLSETLLRAGLRLAGGSELGSAASASQSSSALVKPTELQLQLSTEQIAARKQAVVKMLRKVRDVLVLGFAVLCNCTPPYADAMEQRLLGHAHTHSIAVGKLNLSSSLPVARVSAG